MKKILTFAALMLSISSQAQLQHDWENPAVLGINKLPYHATLQLPSKWKACKEIVSLDGQWLFHWSRKPEERVADFYREDYDVSGWDKITVPGNWQTQGSVFQTEKRLSASMVVSRFASGPGTMAKRIWKEFVIPMKSIVAVLSI